MTNILTCARITLLASRLKRVEGRTTSTSSRIECVYVSMRDFGGKVGDEVTVDLIEGFHVSVIGLYEFSNRLIEALGRRASRSLVQEISRNQQLDA